MKETDIIDKDVIRKNKKKPIHYASIGSFLYQILLKAVLDKSHQSS